MSERPSPAVRIIFTTESEIWTAMADKALFLKNEAIDHCNAVKNTADSLNILTEPSDVLSAISDIMKAATNLDNISRHITEILPVKNHALTVTQHDPDHIRQKVRDAFTVLQEGEKIASEGRTACEDTLNKLDERLAQACLAEAESLLSQARTEKAKFDRIAGGFDNSKEFGRPGKKRVDAGNHYGDIKQSEAPLTRIAEQIAALEKHLALSDKHPRSDDHPTYRIKQSTASLMKEFGEIWSAYKSAISTAMDHLLDACKAEAYRSPTIATRLAELASEVQFKHDTNVEQQTSGAEDEIQTWSKFLTGVVRRTQGWENTLNIVQGSLYVGELQKVLDARGRLESQTKLLSDALRGASRTMRSEDLKVWTDSVEAARNELTKTDTVLEEARSLRPLTNDARTLQVIDQDTFDARNALAKYIRQEADRISSSCKIAKQLVARVLETGHTVVIDQEARDTIVPPSTRRG